jgi:hypothetical protein
MATQRKYDTETRERAVLGIPPKCGGMDYEE